MFTQILVPLDGSTGSERALPVAAHIARALQARLVLVRIVEPITPYGPYLFVPAGPASVVSDSARDEALFYLAHIAQSDTLAGITTTTRVYEGPAARTLLEALENEKADLVVMCSHGRSMVMRWALGAVAQHVARHAPVPVFIVREHELIPDGPHLNPMEPLRMLLPLDGSRVAEAAITPAVTLLCALAGSGRCVLHLTLVVDPYDAQRSHMPDALIVDGATSYLRQSADRIRQEYAAALQLTITWSIAVDHDFAAGLLSMAEQGEIGENTEGSSAEGSCNLIAMATHGRSGFARWTLGSVTERVLQATQLPMLIVRPQQVAELVRPKQQQDREQKMATGTHT